MTEEQEVKTTALRVRLHPYDNPDAEDYYANLTGVAGTPDEVILLFGRILPNDTPPKSGEKKLSPRLRVTLPIRMARNLLGQLGQIFQAREKIEQDKSSQELENAGD